MIGLECLDAPEIHRLSNAKIDGVATTAPQSDTADQQVESAAESPEPVAIEPAVFAADTLDGGKGHFGWRTDRRRT